MSSQIKFVYFDIGGVMLNWKHLSGITARKYNKPLSLVIDVFNQLDDLACRGKLDKKQYDTRFKKMLGLKKTEKFDNIDLAIRHFTPISETHEFAKKLSSRLPIGLLTNIHLGFYDLSLKHGYIPKLNYSAVIQSCDIGLIKPEKEIYLHAQKKAMVPHENILFVDDLLQNVEAARSLGWKTVHFDPDHPKQSIDKVKSML